MVWKTLGDSPSMPGPLATHFRPNDTTIGHCILFRHLDLLLVVPFWTISPIQAFQLVLYTCRRSTSSTLLSVNWRDIPIFKWTWETDSNSSYLNHAEFLKGERSRLCFLLIALFSASGKCLKNNLSVTLAQVLFSGEALYHFTFLKWNRSLRWIRLLSVVEIYLV